MRRYPLVKQTDQSDCGAAALATLARFHGLPLGLQRLRELCGTNCTGTNLFGLQGAAEKIGFSAKAVRGPYEAISEYPLPAIAHVKNAEGLGHFVVLYRADGKSVVVGDPQKGIERVPPDEFRRIWTGYLLVLATQQSVRFESGDAPVTPWRRFLSLVRYHNGLLIEVMLCAVLMTLLGISTSYFVQHLIDSVLVRGETGLLNALGVGMMFIVVFQTLFGMLRHYLLAHIGRKIDLALIAGYARHILSLPMDFFEMRRVGEILSRVNDAGKVREAVGGATLTVVLDGMMVVVALVVLWLYDPQLAMVATVFAPLLVLSVLAHHPAARQLSRQAMEQGAMLSAHLVEDASGVATIKAFGAQSQRADAGEDRIVHLAKSTFSLQLLSIRVGALGGLINSAAGVVVLWYGGHRVIEGALTIGELMFFSTLLSYMLGPLERLASVNLQVQDALIAMDRLYQVMDLDTEANDSRHVPFEGLRQAIDLDGVSFRYGCHKRVLKNVSLTVPAGATVAIVGESGCGKSTLLKLLMRFYHPTEGQILLDGVDQRDFELESMRRGIGLVSQEAFIFSGTIRDNISLGNPRARFDAVIAAARAARLSEFINSLPDRYETMIGERGANLSGGQRQRLAIARAILCNPGILLFDEATSHLDPATERTIQSNLQGVFADKTVVLVAHRLSTVREADLIYVMHEGRIAEHGSHRNLMARGGRYAELWRSQVESAYADQTCSDPTTTNGYLRPSLEIEEPPSCAMT